MTGATMQAVIAWAADAGRREALMAAHDGREVEPGCMGLSQSFTESFPQCAHDDQAFVLYSTVYIETARACAKRVVTHARARRSGP